MFLPVVSTPETVEGSADRLMTVARQAEGLEPHLWHQDHVRESDGIPICILSSTGHQLAFQALQKGGGGCGVKPAASLARLHDRK